MVKVPQTNSLLSMEDEISRAKGDLSRLSRERSKAFASGRHDEVIRTQVALLERQLKNIASIVSYIRAVSPSAAREIDTRHRFAASRFEAVRNRPDAGSLQDWVKGDLAPLLSRTEQVAYLVASSVRYREGTASTPFVWKWPPSPNP